MPKFLWGKQALDVDVYEAALDRVRLAYRTFDNVIVSFSGGKDSTAILNVTCQIAREQGRDPVETWFLDEEAIATETADYVRRVAARDDVDLTWFTIPVRHQNGCSRESPWWYPWGPEDRHLWVREPPTEAVGPDDLDWYEDEGPDRRPTWPDFAKHLAHMRRGTTGFIMGIRADESIVRRAAVANARPDNFIIEASPRVSKVYPIYDWSTPDVWTAPKLYGWDYNEAYDLMEMAGIAPHDQRCAPPFGDNPRKGLWMWSVCFPDVWERLCRRVPGAATGARYGDGQLYSANKRTKPDGLTWKRWIRRLIEQHEDDDYRAHTAQAVEQAIRRHYSKTSEPILGPRHPWTGVGWEWVAQIAEHGDPKNRIGVMETMGNAATPRAQERYDEAYREWESQRG